MILGNIFQGSQLLPLAKSFGNITSTGLQQVQHFFLSARVTSSRSSRIRFVRVAVYVKTFFSYPPPSQIFSNKHAQHNPRPKSSKTSKTCNRINRHQSAGSRLDFFLSEIYLWFLDSVQTCMMNSLYDFLRTHAAFRSSFVTH